MTTGAVYDRLDTALYDGNINVNVPLNSFDGVPASMQVAAPVTLDGDHNLWFKLLRGFEAYGGTWKTQGLISYGQNRYDFNRYIPYYGDKLSSDYKARIWDVDAKVTYLPQQNRTKSWQVAPYGRLSYTHASQGAYAEQGRSIFAQSMDSASHNSLRAEGGVEWTVQGELRGEHSAHDHSEVYSLMAKHAF